MPGLRIYRAEAFRRGDESVSIFMDGKPLGALPNKGPLLREIIPGAHTLQAWMNGAKGRKMDIQVAEGEEIDIVLSKTRIPEGGWWEAIAFLLLCGIPDEALSGRAFWIKMSLFAIVLTYGISDLLKRRRNFLKLERKQSPLVQPVSDKLKVSQIA